MILLDVLLIFSFSFFCICYDPVLFKSPVSTNITEISCDLFSISQNDDSFPYWNSNVDYFTLY